MKDTKYLERYLTGEHQRVWEEMYRFSRHTSKYEPDVWENATAVAQETMRRVKHNLETLVERWQAIGFEFEYPVIQPPVPNLPTLIADYEAKIRPLPLALRVWWETIGSVNFTCKGHRFTHPRTGKKYVLSDPLWVTSAEKTLSDAISRWEWKQTISFKENENLYFVFLDGTYGNLAPDIQDKDKPDATIPTEQEKPAQYTQLVSTPENVVFGTDYVLDYSYIHGTPFVHWLRLNMQWAGFPGFALYGKRFYPERFAPDDDLPQLLQEVARDLLPF